MFFFNFLNMTSFSPLNIFIEAAFSAVLFFSSKFNIWGHLEETSLEYFFSQYGLYLVISLQSLNFLLKTGRFIGYTLAILGSEFCL